MNEKTKKLNEELKRQLSIEQGVILTEITKRAEYGSEAGLLIEVMKAKTILDEAKQDLCNMLYAKEKRNNPELGKDKNAGIYVNSDLETLAVYQYWVEKWFGE